MRLVARVTGWAAAGGLLATGLFAGIAAASNPGHAKVAPPTTTSGATATTTPQQDQTTTTLDDGFGTQDPQPFQPPQNAPGNDVRGGGNVVSGGS
jgi:hypothetical protein